MKQMEVTILGQSYILGCPDGGEASLQAAVATVDREMSAIRDAGKVKARERIAVLAALNLAYALAERPASRHSQSADPGNSADFVATDAEVGHLDVGGLIRRIDHALGANGQLL